MTAAILNNESELIHLMIQGDKKAFRRLFDHYWNNIYTTAFALTKSAELSEELVQDIFLKIWLKRDMLTNVTNFGGYLFMVAKHHIYNELRRKTSEKSFTTHLDQYFSSIAAGPDQAIILKETKQLIENAVKQLPDQQRTVYELSRNDGMDQSGIAEKLGISKFTVKSHMNKALQKIRQYLLLHSDAYLFIFALSIVYR